MASWQAIEYGYDDRSGLYRRVKTTQVSPFVVVFARDEVVAQLKTVLSCPSVRVTTSRQLEAEALKPGAVVFIDWDNLCHVDPVVTPVPIVALMDETPEALSRIIRSLDAYPWLSHWFATPLLARPTARSALVRLVERLATGVAPNMPGEARIARLAKASHRESRFERIRMFFADRGVSGRIVDRIFEVYEELVTNALYDAPFEAGVFKTSIPRTDDVDLPHDRACEISYGLDSEHAYLRVRDTFGALTRKRMTSVLVRCNSAGVAIDDSRGGAGLGLWRVFSAASSLSITVDPGAIAEILVGIAVKDKRSMRPTSVDLFFVPAASHKQDADAGRPELDQSITVR